MRLSIEKNEATEGVFFKKTIYELWVRGELTPEELNAYEKVKGEIDKVIIAEYSYKGQELNYTIGRFVYDCKKSVEKKEKGSRFVVYKRHDIPLLEKEIKEGVEGFSKYLKNIMSDSHFRSSDIEF